MLRVFIVLLLIIHGLIHSMGFIRSVNPQAVPQFTATVSASRGYLWLATSCIFVVGAILMLFRSQTWWAFALLAIGISQVLIIQQWQEARFGTVANVILLFFVIAGMAESRFRSSFNRDAEHSLANSANEKVSDVRPVDQLPEPVQKYLKFTGYAGQPVTRNFTAQFHGHIRSGPEAKWMEFTARQVSTLSNPTRLFFLDASMMGIPVAGYHKYKDGNAMMDIRALSMFAISREDGRQMAIAETVTHFNDMCILAPGSLRDPRIRWQTVNDKEVEACFVNNDISVKAILLFNDEGALVNFISDDRYLIIAGKAPEKARWMTPVQGYHEKNGIRFPGYGEAIWVMPDKEFIYARMEIEDITVNTH